jgi:hypothetical protein
LRKLLEKGKEARLKNPSRERPLKIVGFGDFIGGEGEKGELKNLEEGLSKPFHWEARSYRALKASNHRL